MMRVFSLLFLIQTALFLDTREAKNLRTDDVLSMFNSASDVESVSVTDRGEESDKSDCGADTNSERDIDALRGQETLDTTRDGAGTDSEHEGNADGDTAGVSGEGIPNVSAAAETSSEEGVTSEESESDNNLMMKPKEQKESQETQRMGKTKGFNEGIVERDTLQLLESR